jgi:hypothetical protein
MAASRLYRTRFLHIPFSLDTTTIARRQQELPTFARRYGRSILRVALGLTSVLIAGCSLTSTAPLSPAKGLSLSGSVHGGQQPIAGSHIYLLSAATTGYGQPSVSLLDPLITGKSDSVGAYVTTTGDGSFSITGDYTCVPGTQAYLYALGGNPGAGTNPSAGLLAALGDCPVAGTYLGTTSFIVVNEVSTIAAAYAIAGFATDATHVASSATPLARTGMANAFANVTNLAPLASGAALSRTPAGNGFVPQAKINALANILASCIDSSGTITGPTSPTTCYTLFHNATSDGTSGGVIPSDTATAAINIAHNPGVNIAALYDLITSTVPFQPTLSSQPSDFTLSLMFQTGGFTGSTSTEIAIDSQGNAWYTNATSTTNVINDIVKLSPLGVALSPASGFTGGGLNAPHAIAIDNEDNVWIGNSTYFTGQGSLTKLDNSGVPFAGSPFTGGGVANPRSLAIDSSDNVWVANSNSLSKFSSAGSAQSPAGGYTNGGIMGTTSVAVDASGDIFVANEGGHSVSKFTNAAVSVPGFPIFINNNTYPTALQSLALDAQGNVTIDNSNPGNIYKTSNDGSEINGYPVAIRTGSGGEIVIDGAGSVWIQNHNRINEVSASGTLLTPQGLSTNGSTYGIAVDGSGDIWTALPALGSLEEIIGSAAPVVTPIAAAVKNNTIGSRP